MEKPTESEQIAAMAARARAEDTVSIPRELALLLTGRKDILVREAELVFERRMTWEGRLLDLGDYGRTGGGSSSDRRKVVQAMALLERRAKR